jgi:hypothetical protein
VIQISSAQVLHLHCQVLCNWCEEVKSSIILTGESGPAEKTMNATHCAFSIARLIQLEALINWFLRSGLHSASMHTIRSLSGEEGV